MLKVWKTSAVPISRGEPAGFPQGPLYNISFCHNRFAHFSTCSRPYCYYH